MPSRRAFLAATAATAAFAAAPGAPGAKEGVAWAATGAVTASSLDLAPLDPKPLLDDRVGRGLVRSVLIRWGDAVLPAAPAFAPDHPSAEAAGHQFGWDGVVAGITVPPPAGDGIARLVATIAHPWPEPAMAFPDGAAHPAIAARMQGASVLDLQFTGGRWLVVAGGYQMRRLDDTTLCRLTGPAAAAVGNVVQGLLAPSGGAATPWGTVLLGEDAVAPHLAALAGVEKRFAAAGMAARFGWVTEIDPLDPFNIPAKRTALGRFPHAGIAAGRSADGRAVVFLAVDRPEGRLLRFVSAAPVAAGGPRANDALLDSGTLAVARLKGRKLVWQALDGTVPSMVGALDAASAAGGEGFDHPAGLALAPGGALFLACRGNPARRTPDFLNPRAGNAAGHVLAFHPEGGDLAAAAFAAEVALLGGDPKQDATARYGAGSPAWLARPATLSFDPAGRLWIGSDQGGEISATADGLYAMDVRGPGRYVLEAAYFAPLGAAVGGVGFSPKGRSGFAMVRHPGAVAGADFARPATRWPTVRPGMPPQSALIGLARRDGGRLGG